MNLTASTLSVRNARTGELVSPRIRVASRGFSRLRGLLGRPEPPPGEGLLLVPCAGVHTLGMRYAIDVAFIDREGRVVRTCSALRPVRAIPFVRRAYLALELRSGTLAESTTRAGDLLLFEPVVAHAGAPTRTVGAGSAARGRQPARGASTSRAATPVRDQLAAAANEVQLPAAALLGVLLGLAVMLMVAEARTPLLFLPLALAVWIDLRSRRIPNWLTLGGTSFALASAGRSDLLLVALGMVAAGGAGLVLAVAARGGFGMGDVKLMAYSGAAVALPEVPLFLLAMSLVGGAIAVAALMQQGLRRGITIAYGPAIAAGCAWVLIAG